ncbi:MAG: RlmE family RNA methyltransferase [Deltaproteobacteria bacterium]|nr:RlmE family RNA methyltransferase [Deltaproteobacteria bacterium]
MGSRRQDHFARRARQENFPARSVYKLEEIDRRLQLTRPGQHVLDLGAAPGSWTLYLCRAVGPHGLVLAVDPHDLHVPLPPNARFLRGPAADLADEIAAAGPFDLVLSDMAPATTGDRATDQFRSFELFSTAADLAARSGRDGSSFAGKIFQGSSFEEARARLRDLFIDVRVVRPKATRSESYEVFLCGIGKKS